jgi:ribonuclease D
LIQVATPKKVYLFDVLKGGDRLFFDRGLRYLLESNKIVKVMHDCRKDSEALYYQYDVSLRGVWDSQIAYSVLSQLKGYKTPYPIGLNTLLKACCCEENKFKDMVKSAMTAMRNFWEVRPLSRMMIDYAAGDVSNLLRVYSMLNNELQSCGKNYDFNRIIEDYSIEYLEMNILEKVQEKTNNSLYGINTWDQDIGFGTRDDGILEEYDSFCSSSSDTSSSGEPSTPPGSEKKKRRKRRRRVKRADVLNFEDFPPLQPSLQVSA